MTLNKTWKECLRMWKWIAEVWKPEMEVVSLKKQWLREHGYGTINLRNDCFFCEYMINNRDIMSIRCEPDCPGGLVNSRFSCVRLSYDYAEKPKAFYRKLVALNKKRLEKP